MIETNAGIVIMSMNFQPIALDRRRAYLDKLRQCDQIASDYSFINLWCWGPEFGLQWAWHKDLVWLRQTIPERIFWAPVGNWRTTDWSSGLAEAAEFGCPFIRVPEALVALWKTAAMNDFEVIASRNHWDYLYKVEELVELKGNRFHKKKNLVSQFEKKFAYTYHGFGEEMVAKALAMQDDWCTWRDCDSNDMLNAENRAIARVMADWTKLPEISGGALEVDGKLAAYTIAEILPDRTLVIHFEKGDPTFKGAYQAINQKFLAHVPAEIQTVNREQDLGDDGLRKAKLSYQPIGFIKKFGVTVCPAA